MTQDNKLLAFLKPNVKQAETHFLKLERFDEEIELRIITSQENDELQKKAMKTVRVGKKTQKQFDAIEYNKQVSIASIVFPDLNLAEIQESWGVHGARELYDAMFLYGEQAVIAEKVQEISGINSSINDEIEESKN